MNKYHKHHDIGAVRFVIPVD